MIQNVHNDSSSNGNCLVSCSHSIHGNSNHGRQDNDELCDSCSSFILPMSSLGSSSHHKTKYRFPPSRTSLNSGNSRHVGFHSSNTSLTHVQRISRVSDYDSFEIKAVWGDDSEDHQRQEDLKRDIHEYKYNHRTSDNDSSNFTSLGLLDKVSGTKRRSEKIKLREQAWSNVLWEQYYQTQSEDDFYAEVDDEGCQDGPVQLDDDLIASVYEKPSQLAQERAQDAALRLHRKLNSTK